MTDLKGWAADMLHGIAINRTYERTLSETNNLPPLIALN
jgi:hypothetical protein